jgi:outer membrane protein assembly factor BamB
MLSPTIVVILAATLSAGPAEEWSRFRGPNGSGLSTTTGLPTEFGPSLNFLWETELPQGFSSPVVSGDRIFLTGFKDEKLWTMAVDRRSGKILWQNQAPRDRVEKLDSRNHPASPSAATDGNVVAFFFADYGLLAYDVNGTELWRKPLGPFNNVYGMGASPFIVDDLVVLNCDQNLGSFIVAFDKKTGKERWRTPRPEAHSGHSTPIVYKPPEGGTQIVVPGSFLLIAYDANDGTRVWWVRGLSFELKSVPVIDGDTLYINGFGSADNDPGRHVDVTPASDVFPKSDTNGDGKLSEAELPNPRVKAILQFIDLDGDKSLSREEWDYYKATADSENGMLAIRLGGKGDMTDKAVRWKYQRSVPQLPSPLIYHDVLYMVNDGGIVTSLKPDTGEVIQQGRLKGAIDRYYASPVAGDGKLYMASEKGKVAVLKPDGSLEPIAVNDLQDDIYATPALVDGRIYLRTRSTLYCFGQLGK